MESIFRSELPGDARAALLRLWASITRDTLQLHHVLRCLQAGTTPPRTTATEQHPAMEGTEEAKSHAAGITFRNEAGSTLYVRHSATDHSSPLVSADLHTRRGASRIRCYWHLGRSPLHPQPNGRLDEDFHTPVAAP